MKFEIFDNTEQKSSFIGSLFKSEILVRTGGIIEGEISHKCRYRTSNDSILKKKKKIGLLDGHYIAEMSYSFQNQPKNNKNSLKQAWSSFCYKAPTQKQAYVIVEKQMRKEKYS